MADRFRSLTLQDGLVKYRHRAYTLEGVRAKVERRLPLAGSSSGLRLRRTRKTTATEQALFIEGPGFRWSLPVSARNVDEATDFAEHLNEAARAYAFQRSGGGRSLDDSSAVQPNANATHGRADLGSPSHHVTGVTNRPDIIERALSTADQGAAQKARLAR